MDGKNIIKIVYFDLNGIFFDYRQSLERLVSLLGTDINTFTPIFKKYDALACLGEITAQQMYEKFASELKLSFLPDLDFAKFWADNFKPIQESQNLIDQISQEYEVGFITNIYYRTFSKILGKYIPRRPYNHVIQSCDLGLKKPDTEIFKYAQKIAQVEPSEILFVDDDDTGGNISVPKSMGWNTIWFDNENIDISIDHIYKHLGMSQ